MEHPPTGDVTFLFTDIEGSTRLLQSLGADYETLLADHHHLLRQAITANDGYEVLTTGDGFFVVFRHAGEALRCAWQAQRALQSHPWPRDTTLRVRMGLHSGIGRLKGTGYVGLDVHQAARVADAGNGGQVLLSQATRDLVAEGLPPDLQLRDLGEHRLKDLRHSAHLYQLLATGLQDVARPPRTIQRLHERDRIVIVDPATDTSNSPIASQSTLVERSVTETFEALAAVVRGEIPTARFTADQLRAASLHRPEDLREYRLGRIAAWSQPRHRLDGRFVALTLLIDQGEESLHSRWLARDERFDDLGALARTVAEPALVILGPPGCGKSTLLRRYELDTSIRALRGEIHAVTIYVPLNEYPATSEAHAPLLPPDRWLAERWASRYPELPDLATLLAAGRVTFLLDALNELPSTGRRDLDRQIADWKQWLRATLTRYPGNRVVFSCRSLDYSQPLSTPDLRVPQVRVEPLSDAKVKEFIRLYSPVGWRELWASLESSPQLDLLRSPYFLGLLVEQARQTGGIPQGRASLFTGFVRQALRREVERGDRLFQPDGLVTERDCRQLTHWRWRSEHDLPDRGRLVPGLVDLAYGMQDRRSGNEQVQMRIEPDEALVLLDSRRAEEILRAGTSLAILDEDTASDAIMFVHQLVQEYFAARKLAAAPQPSLMQSEWRADLVRPSLDATVAELAPADPLPSLPPTSWAETAIMAAVMSANPESFVRELADENLCLAGRCAAQPELRDQLDAELVEALQWKLVERSRDPAADLRARIEAGSTLGRLGDPRFEVRLGPQGAYRLPPMVRMPEGAYPIGNDGSRFPEESPRHRLRLPAFEIGRFPVTNAEFRCFVDAGGYEDPRWWDTSAARAWLGGAYALAGDIEAIRLALPQYRADPSLLEEALAQGMIDEAVYERWQRLLASRDEDIESVARELLDADRRPTTGPLGWDDPLWSNPSQPVAGVSWFEARAYCRWLSAQTGDAYRLPSEPMWEAAARGAAGRRYPYGDAYEPHRGNVLETHVRRTTPVGIFPQGDTPEGVSDLFGNVYDWVSTLFGRSPEDPDFPYPYTAEDGREDPRAPVEVLRILRGGNWRYGGAINRSGTRVYASPAARQSVIGFRVARG